VWLIAEPALITDCLYCFSGGRLDAIDRNCRLYAVKYRLHILIGFALIALVIVVIVENGRLPVDNPATHLERLWFMRR